MTDARNISSKARNGRVLFASLIGTTIEFYDFYIYATAAVLVFPKLFFPGGDPTTAVISKATLELPFEFPEDYRQMAYYPQVLSPTMRIKTDTSLTFAGLADASVSAEDQGDLNRSLLSSLNKAESFPTFVSWRRLTLTPKRAL